MQTSAYRLVLERARREERLHEGLRGGRVGPQGQRVELRATEQAVSLTKFISHRISPTELGVSKCYRARRVGATEHVELGRM